MRQALNLAIDPEAIVKTVFNNEYIAGNQFVAPGTTYYNASSPCTRTAIAVDRSPRERYSRSVTRPARALVIVWAVVLAGLAGAGTHASAAPAARSYLPPVRSALPQSLPLPIATDVPIPNFVTTFGTRSWAFGDINGDGLNDIVVVPAYGRWQPIFPVQIWINQGDGRFVDQTAQWVDGTVPLVDSPQIFLIADFNGDGRADLVIAQSGSEDRIPPRGGTLIALMSQPNGKVRDTSAEAFPANPESHVQSAVLGDVNGDGALDIVISHPPQPEFPGTGVLLLLNDGQGRFTSTVVGLPDEIAYFNFPPPPAPFCCPSRPFQEPNAVGAGDVDGDGRVDLLTGSGPGGDDFTREPNRRTIRVHQQQADGTFIERVRLPVPAAIENVGYVTETLSTDAPLGLSALEIAVVDLNGDGRPEIVVLWEGWANHIGIFRNDGDFHFSDVTLEWFGAYMTGRGATNVGTQRFVDVNGDGFPDLVLGTPAYTTLPAAFTSRSFIFLNDGSGRFTPWILRVNGQTPDVAALTSMLGCDASSGQAGPCVQSYIPMLFDASGDGLPDVVLVNRRDTVAAPIREQTLYVHTFIATSPTAPRITSFKRRSG